jgi:membrane protease YdiL (CAAX protease family)
MDTEFNIGWEARQMHVLTFGIIGGAALATLQVMMGVFDMVFVTAPATTDQLTILAAVSEELMFTMVLFGTLLMVAKHFGLHWIWAAVPSSIIFALFHFFAYGLQWYGIILLIMAGIILRWSYMKTKDIGTPIIAHMINNGLVMGMLSVVEMVVDYWWLIMILGMLLLLPTLILKRR